MAVTTLGLVMEQLMAPRFTQAIARNHGDTSLEEAAKYFGRGDWDDPLKAMAASDFIEEAGGDPGVIRLLSGPPEHGSWSRIETDRGRRYAFPIDPNKPIPSTHEVHGGAGYFLERPGMNREELPLAIGPTMFSAPGYGMAHPVHMQAFDGGHQMVPAFQSLPFPIGKQPSSLGELHAGLAAGELPWRVGHSGPVDASGQDLAERLFHANYNESPFDDYDDLARQLAEWEFKNPVVDIPRFALGRIPRGTGPQDLDLSML